MSFYEYLSNFLEDDTPKGDFVRNVYRDKTFPQKITSFRDVENHLVNVHKDVMDATKSAYNLYLEDK